MTSISATHSVSATPAQVFAVLTNPGQHQFTEPTDWVREAIDPEQLTRSGQVFGLQMFHRTAGGEYQMDNRVDVLEPDRAISWLPGWLDEHGEHVGPGWSWRYDLVPQGAGTGVTLTYDWSAASVEDREKFSLPAVDEDYLRQSLEALDGHLNTSALRTLT